MQICMHLILVIVSTSLRNCRSLKPRLSDSELLTASLPSTSLDFTISIGFVKVMQINANVAFKIVTVGVTAMFLLLYVAFQTREHHHIKILFRHVIEVCSTFTSILSGDMFSANNISTNTSMNESQAYVFAFHGRRFRALLNKDNF